MATSRLAAGAGAALASGVAYGASGPFATLTAAMGVSGGDVVLWRAVIMLALMAAVVAVLRARAAVDRETGLWLVALGLGTAVTSVSYLSSVAYVPVAVAAILFYTFPILTLLLSPLIDRTRITPARLAVFVVAFGGIVLVVGQGTLALDWRGLVFAGLASLGATSMMFTGTRAMRRTTPLVAALWLHVVIVPVTLLAVLAMGGLAALPATVDFALVFGVLVGTYVAGYLLQLWALGRIPAVVAGILFLIEPVVAILIAALVLGERLAGPQYIGCAIVLAALLASVAVERREHAPPKAA